jgi:hypothetical protein
MSIKRTNSQSYRLSSSSTQRTSDRYTPKNDRTTSSNTQLHVSNGAVIQKSEKLKQKRQIAPEKLKTMRQVYTNISNGQLRKIRILLPLE